MVIGTTFAVLITTKNKQQDGNYTKKRFKCKNRKIKFR